MKNHIHVAHLFNEGIPSLQNQYNTNSGEKQGEDERFCKKNGIKIEF